ncbi:hypothetical protein LSAT2_009543 [Lamellibrachia satsuma]|nr:hypothetical protein LSAT2_009543 [Lamellibrachia satsuma]
MLAIVSVDNDISTAYEVVKDTNTIFIQNIGDYVALYELKTTSVAEMIASSPQGVNLSCSNWVDFVKSGCEKSWAEVQADSFSFECRGCAKMKELEVELEELRLLVVAMVGREQGCCASSSGGGTVDDKVGKDTRDARESSPQPGRKLRGGKVTGHRETGRKETGRKGTGWKTTGVKERGVGETGGKEKGVGETGGKTTGVKERGVAETGGKEKGVGETGGKTTGVKERGVGETGGKEKGVGETEGKTTGVKERGVGETRAKEWEVGLTGGKGSGQNVMEGIERKSYSAAVIEGVRKRARVFVGDSIVRKTDRVLNKGDDVVVCLPGAKIEAITERVIDKFAHFAAMNTCRLAFKKMLPPVKHSGFAPGGRLESCHIPAAGMVALAVELQHLTALKTLNLDWNIFDAVAATALGRSLSLLRQLETLM